MLKNHPSFTTIILLLLLASCTVEPEPIDYGKDACSYCRMNIVDRQHAAEFVTKKGKVFKFDAIECMMNYVKDIDTSTVALYLTSDYDDPGVLMDATTATYLHSEKIPSPMGGFLSSFKNTDAAEKTRVTAPGKLLTWQELKSEFNQ